MIGERIECWESRFDSNNLTDMLPRVAAGPGKPGSQGKVREFHQSGKVGEKSGKMTKKFEKSGKNKRKISTFSNFFFRCSK